MLRQRVNWRGAGRIAAIAAACAVAVAVLPGLLTPPDPPKPAADVGLPTVATKAAAPEATAPPQRRPAPGPAKLHDRISSSPHRQRTKHRHRHRPQARHRHHTQPAPPPPAPPPPAPVGAAVAPAVPAPPPPPPPRPEFGL